MHDKFDQKWEISSEQIEKLVKLSQKLEFNLKKEDFKSAISLAKAINLAMNHRTQNALILPDKTALGFVFMEGESSP